MATVYLKEDEHVARQVPFSCQVRSEGDGGEVVGITHNAFRLKANEDYLSVAWLEFFQGEFDQQLNMAVRQIHSVRPGKVSTGYWAASIGHMRAALRNHPFRASHEPVGEFTSHSALRRWPVDDELLLLLSESIMAELHFLGQKS